MSVSEKFISLVLLVIMFVLTGCRSPYHSDRLGLLGGLTGAGLGAAVGEATGKSAEGALVGAAIGSLTGAVVGDHLDEAEARNQAVIEQQLGRQMAGAVTMDDAVAMSKAGLSDEVIRTHIAAYGVARALHAQDLIMLKEQGVSDAVIQSLQAPPPRTLQSQDSPPRRAPPVVVEEHYYGVPFPFSWRGYGHHHHRRRPGVSWGFSFHK